MTNSDTNTPGTNSANRDIKSYIWNLIEEINDRTYKLDVESKSQSLFL